MIVPYLLTLMLKHNATGGERVPGELEALPINVELPFSFRIPARHLPEPK